MHAGANIRVFNKEYHTILENISSKKNEIAGMDIFRESINLSSSISALNDNMASFEKEIDVSKKHLKSLEDSAALKKKDLQQTVLAIDNRKRIQF
jgi:predicted  nucleic acid-binding Zn-ribbon protein